MKKSLLSFLTVSTTVMSFGQTVHRCASREAITYQEQFTPNYGQLVNQQFEIAKTWSQNHDPVRSVYTIPVVFHVVYNNANENLPDSVLLNQINVLNEAYARLNADTVNLRSEFNPVAGATQVRFALATLDPNGNPTTGITRTSTSVASFGSLNSLFGDLSGVEKVKSTTDGGIDGWDGEHYLNIWICDMSYMGSVFLLGYATPPDGLPNWPAGSVAGLGDGVVLQYQVVGSNNSLESEVGVGDILGRTAIHEVGHYLGLRHIWGDGDCTMDDGVNDTPDATEASQQDCDVTKNTCNADVVGLGDLHDMIENYMDYSSEACQNSFTGGQAALMHGVLENDRYDLVHNNPALSVNELVKLVSVYPNPAKESVIISTKESIAQVQLIDVNGMSVAAPVSGTVNPVINLSELSAGVYLLSITFEDGSVQQQRVVKN